MKTDCSQVFFVVGAVLVNALTSVGAEPATPPDTPAVLVSQVVPVFPKALKDRGIRGSVRVGFDVDTKGNVRRPYIVEPGSDVRFDNAALAAVRKWKFSPCLVNGRPKLVHLSQWILFDFEQPRSSTPNEVLDPAPQAVPQNEQESSKR